VEETLRTIGTVSLALTTGSLFLEATVALLVVAVH
jgi:hypothetical protein